MKKLGGEKTKNEHGNNRRRRNRRELSRESKEREIRNEIKLFGGHVKMGENMKESWEKDVERICKEVKFSSNKFAKWEYGKVINEPPKLIKSAPITTACASIFTIRSKCLILNIGVIIFLIAFFVATGIFVYIFWGVIHEYFSIISNLGF